MKNLKKWITFQVPEIVLRRDLAEKLFDASVAFHVEPLPDGQWAVSVKEEHRAIVSGEYLTELPDWKIL